MEEWRDIPGFKGRYQASTEGRIKSLEKLVEYHDHRPPYIRPESILSLAVKDTGYYVCNIYKNNKRYHSKVHRLVAETFLEGYLEDMFVDHIDNDRKNNKVENLRMCTNRQNAYNQKRREHKMHSKYKGVTKNKHRGKWLAYIKPSFGTKYLGSFEREIDAATAYDTAAVKYFGEFARTNKMLGLL